MKAESFNLHAQYLAADRKPCLSTHPVERLSSLRSKLVNANYDLIFAARTTPVHPYPPVRGHPQRLRTSAISPTHPFSVDNSDSTAPPRPDPSHLSQPCNLQPILSTL